MSERLDVTVRPVRWEDFDDLRETYFQLYDERDAGEPIGIHLFAERPSLADEADWFAAAFRKAAKGDAIFLVAEVEGHAVGSCTVARLDPAKGSETAHVGELGILVRRGFRGRGVGTALFERSIAEAPKLFEIVFLSVFSVNTGAHRLYERYGFRDCGHLPAAVKRGGQYLDMERMFLDLRSPR